jgi:cell division protein FtsI (penicillin-binding protein 3)
MEDVRKDILWRVYLVYMLMLLFGAAIILKVFYIQTIERGSLLEKSKKQTLQYFEVEAVRGNICDANGNLLVTSVPIFDVRMDVASPLISKQYFQNHVGGLATALAKLFGDKSANAYKNDLTRERREKNRYYLVKKDVTYDQLQKIKSFPIFNRGKNKGGLIIVNKSKREYPFGSLAIRTLGYEKKEDTIGVGIEYAYTDYLGGVNGKQLRRRINNGDWVPVPDSEEIEPDNGDDVITTIDVNLQDVAESSLYSHLVHHQAEWGCAILMEVETGEIKAISNLSKNKNGEGYRETYNYAIGWSFEPGSTFKLPSMLAMFEDGLDDLDDTIDIGKGVTSYSGLKIRDIHPIRDGKVSIREIFEASSNVGVSKLVTRMYEKKPQKYIDRLYDMSLNDKLDLELTGEGEPFIKNTKNPSWSKVTLPFMSIGYELKLTPLQILTFYNAVANNGKMVKPKFVKEIQRSGRTIKTFKTEVINSSICSRSSIKKAKELLEGVVERGTANTLNKSVYKIAGKTGTAQIAGKGYDKSNYNASFVGYFPADNPKYSCIVVVSKPQGAYYASAVAVPVFQDISDKVYATNISLQKQEDEKYERITYPVHATGLLDELEMIYETLDIPLDDVQTKSEWALSEKSDTIVKLEMKTIKEGMVPSVKGMGAKDAVYILENMGLKVNLSGRGFVREQSIPPGTKVIKGRQIVLKLEV